jgi:hypothetical protein
MAGNLFHRAGVLLLLTVGIGKVGVGDLLLRFGSRDNAEVDAAIPSIH